MDVIHAQARFDNLDLDAVLTRCRYAQPLCVFFTHKNDTIRTLKILVVYIRVRWITETRLKRMRLTSR